MIRRENTVANTNGSKTLPTFGARMGVVPAADAEPMTQAEVWLNIGYETGDETYPIVTLPYGIPIDTQKPLKLTGRNEAYLQFTDARNGLLKQIQTLAEDLAPGDEAIIRGFDGGLVLQLRRKNSEVSEVPTNGSNPFVRDLFEKAA